MRHSKNVIVCSVYLDVLSVRVSGPGGHSLSLCLISCRLRLHTMFDPWTCFIHAECCCCVCVCCGLFSLFLCELIGQYVEDRGEEGQPLSTRDGS